MHVPDFVSPEYCNKSLRGRFGDALQEMDGLAGKILQALKDNQVDEKTIVFFSRWRLAGQQRLVGWGCSSPAHGWICLHPPSPPQ